MNQQLLLIQYLLDAITYKDSYKLWQEYDFIEKEWNPQTFHFYDPRVTMSRIPGKEFENADVPNVLDLNWVDKIIEAAPNWENREASFRTALEQAFRAGYMKGSVEGRKLGFMQGLDRLTLTRKEED